MYKYVPIYTLAYLFIHISIDEITLLDTTARSFRNFFFFLSDFAEL